jgi:predicted nucleic acid-binding OB-fold protein
MRAMRFSDVLFIVRVTADLAQSELRMINEASSITLTHTEIELLLTALAYFEMSILDDRQKHSFDSMRTLREKMLGTLRAVNRPVATPDAKTESN